MKTVAFLRVLESLTFITDAELRLWRTSDKTQFKYFLQNRCVLLGQLLFLEEPYFWLGVVAKAQGALGKKALDREDQQTTTLAYIDDNHSKRRRRSWASHLSAMSI